MVLVLLSLIVAFLIVFLIDVLHPKPKFDYPNCPLFYDITGRRNPSINECLDEQLIYNHNKGNNNQEILVEIFNNGINIWKNECEKIISKTIIRKKYHIDIYNNILSTSTQYDYPFFNFCLIRNNNVVKIVPMTLQEILTRDKELSKINYETTLEKYHAKNQRSLMTKELREKIMKRDNYTCKICGKYMPDEVGLQIDHIIPIKKGGKTIESNLQVLCNKCNRSKSDK